MKLTDAEKKALKGRGYILNRDGEHFIARIITEDGTLTSEELAVVSEAAKTFGSGCVAMTSRMTVEVGRQNLWQRLCGHDQPHDRGGPGPHL